MRLSALCVVLFVAACSDTDNAGEAQVQADSQGIEIRAARLRLPLPGTDKSVGYFELINRTETPLVLEGASSPTIGAIEMHETLEQGGMMRMRRLPRLPIEPGQHVQFEPGGKHLMLFRVAELVEPVQVTLRFSAHPPLEVEFQTFSIR